MPTQHDEALLVIQALKRKLKRDQEGVSDQPIASATNRGNKLKQGAENVRSGALPYPHGKHGFKEQIEHHGYTRYVVARKPKRYNDYGYELDDSDPDIEADVDAENGNPYSDVHIEELLRPLTHPSELATHPTLSLPFLDPALPTMIDDLQEKLRQERANLWRAKALHRQLIGDESWIPAGAVETKDDWDLFEPRIRSVQDASRKRKRNETDGAIGNGVHPHTQPVEALTEQGEPAQPPSNADAATDDAPAPVEEASSETVQETPADDVEMHDEAPTTNGVHVKDEAENRETVPDASIDIPKANGDTTLPDEDADGEADDNNNNASGSNSPAPPTRRITRALAAENTSTAPTPPDSPISETTVDSSLLIPDPLFLLPTQLATMHRLPSLLQSLQLPVEELLETRRLLLMYIQKQEETVRGFEAVLGKLIKAKRMKMRLWEMCKAEGHVGEMSDGEDWIDAEAWGERPEELKKGKDEEDVTQEEETRKGKRRRARDREAGRERE